MESPQSPGAGSEAQSSETPAPRKRPAPTASTSERSLKRRAIEERRRIVEAHYGRVGHACERSVHVWCSVFPDDTTTAQIYGAVAAYERRTKRFVVVPHPMPRGWRPAWQVRRDQNFERYAQTWE